jgi:hypothetical protein
MQKKLKRMEIKMAKKLKITTVRQGTISEKIEVKSSLSVNDTEVLENLYDAIDILTDREISKEIEDGGQGMTKDDFVQNYMLMVENGGKFQVNITVN